MNVKPASLFPAAVIGLILLAHAWFVTYGTWNFFFLYKEERSAAYDDLARNLLKGSVQVDPKYTDVETFYVKDKTVMYFGPWPALIRMPLNAAVPSQFGNWARVSCLAADFLLLFFFLRLLGAALSRYGLKENWKAISLSVGLLSLGFASPLLYLMSCPYIYHESALWAWAGSTACLFFLFQIFYGENKLKNYAGLGAAVGITLLSKTTYAFPFCLFLAPYLLYLFIKEKKKFAALFLPLAVFTGFQLWYNDERWGSPFTLLDYNQYWVLFQDPKLLAHFKEIGPVRFERLGITLGNYFGWHAGNFSRQAPYFHFLLSRNSDPRLFLQYYKEWVFPLWAGAFGLVGGGIAGLIYRFFEKHKWGWRDYLKLCLAAQGLLMGAYFFITQRYAVEFMPFFICGVIYGIRQLPQRALKPAFLFFLISFLISAPVNVLSVFSCLIHFQWGVTPDWRAALKALIG